MKRSVALTTSVILLSACPAPPQPTTGPPSSSQPATTQPAPKTTSTPTASKPTLKVHMINVGQGDGLVVECPDGEVGMVIDSADSRDRNGKQAFETYLSKLMERDKDKSIPVVVASHPHSDHIGHLRWVVRKYGIGVFVDNGQPATSKVYRELMAAVRAKADKGKLQHMSMDITPPAGALPKPWKVCDGTPEALVTALVPAVGFQGCKRHPNDCSLVLRLDYGKTSYLFAGDAEHEQEEVLMADKAVAPQLDVDVLKAGHHGSDTSSSEKWLQAVTPKCVLVSAGREGVGVNRRYKHPRASTLRAINNVLGSVGWRAKTARAYDKAQGEWVDMKVKVGVALTPLDGDVVLGSDG